MPGYETLDNFVSPKHGVLRKNTALKQRKSDDNDNGGDKGGNKRATSEDGHLPVHFCCKRWNRVIIKVNIADYKYIPGT